jgi:hypothetical protein
LFFDLRFRCKNPIEYSKLVHSEAGEMWFNIEVYYRDQEISADRITKYAPGGIRCSGKKRPLTTRTI